MYTTKKTLVTRVLSLLMLAVMMLSFAACSTPAPEADTTSEEAPASQSTAEEPTSDEAPAEAKQLNVWIAGTGDSVSGQAYTTIFDAYTTTSGNTVEVTYISWGEYFTKLSTGLIGGAGPDVFLSGYGQFGTLYNMGSLMAIDDYIPEDWDGYDDIQQNFYDVGTVDGSTYGLFMPNTRVITYRKDIAEQNGVTEEDLSIENFDEFVELIKKMTVMDDAGNTTMYGLDLQYATNAEQQMFVSAAMIEDDYHLWNDDSTAAFNTDAAYEVWDTFKQLYDEGYISIKDAAAADNGLMQGTAAMVIDSEAFFANANNTYPDNVGIVGNHSNTLMIGDFFCVNPNGSNIEDSVELLLHMFSIESWETHISVRNAYPARISLTESYAALNAEFDNVVLAFEKSNPYSYTPNTKFTEVVVPLRTAMETVFFQSDSKTELDKAAEEWNGIVAAE